MAFLQKGCPNICSASYHTKTERACEKRQMATSLREIINFSLVILNLELLTSDDAVRAFRNAIDADIRYGGGVAIDAATGQTEQARMLHLDRDRINLNLSPSRSSVTREFPAVSNLKADAERFAHIVNSAVTVGNVPDGGWHDFGYNAEMVFDQDQSSTAVEFIGERLFKSENIESPGRRFFGGACRLIILDELGQWTYNLEPRFNDLQTPRIFANVNLHSAQRPLPLGTQVTDAILQTVSGVQELMDRIGG